MSNAAMQIISDHGFPKDVVADDSSAFEAFKNEQRYVAKGGHATTTAAAMDWAIREIERLRADRAQVYEWIREPDNIDGEASLEWITDWINDRPVGLTVPRDEK